ncbi:MAG: hypothetical protein P4L87_17450 [Formivibrio sp.]|nr:hypothetical protein [Formivibrio sp.]
MLRRALPLFLLTVTLAAQAETRLTVRFANPAWNGVTIPAGQQCPKNGGAGATPALNVFDLPPGTAALLLEFSEKGTGLDNGGMGRIGYTIGKGVNSAQVPSAPGNSMALPPGFFLVSAHRGDDKPGAYLPPCSGGKGARYVLTVRALDAANSNGKVLGEGRLELGKY